MYISVSYESNIMILFYILLDHLFQLLRILNYVSFFLIDKSVLYLI